MNAEATGVCWNRRAALTGAIAAPAVVLAAILLLMSSCSSRGPGYPASATTQVRLTWSEVTFPPDSALAFGDKLAAPAGDGNTAYVCSLAASDGVASIWQTHDRAAHWTKAHPLPAVDHAVNFCSIVVDDYQPSTVLVVVSWAQPSALPLSPDTAASFVTTDGGASWHAVADDRALGVGRLATVRGRTYALANVGCNRNQPLTIENDCLWHLYAISDAWQTWQPIDQIPTQQSEPIGARGFWIDPASEAIFEATLREGSSYSGLWKTTDGGAHWQQVNAPLANSFSGAVSAHGQSVTLCGSVYAGNDSLNPQRGPFKLFCSGDGGATWRNRPILTLPPGKTISIIPRVMTTDSAILQVISDGKTQTLYRLTSAGAQWQSLGHLPGAKDAFLIYGAGALWDVPRPTQRSVPTIPLKDTVFTVFVAAYP